jgi:hypothetical protein
MIVKMVAKINLNEKTSSLFKLECLVFLYGY